MKKPIKIKNTGKIYPKLSSEDIARALGAKLLGQVPKGWHPWMGKPPIAGV